MNIREKLSLLSNELININNIKEGTELVAKIVIKELGFDNFVLLLDNRMNINEESYSLYFFDGFNVTEKEIVKARDSFYFGILEKKLLTTKKILTIENIKEKERFFHPLAIRFLKSVVVTPLYTINRNLGIMYLGNNKITKSFNNTYLENIKLLSNIYSLKLDTIFALNETKVFSKINKEFNKYSSIIKLANNFNKELELLYPKARNLIILFDIQELRGDKFKILTTSNIIEKSLEKFDNNNFRYLKEFYDKFFSNKDSYIWVGRTKRITETEEKIFKVFNFNYIRKYFRNALLIPLKSAKERIYGCIFIFDKRGKVFYESHAKSLLPITNQLSTIIERIENEQLIIIEREKKEKEIKNISLKTVHSIRTPVDVINTNLTVIKRDYSLNQDVNEKLNIIIEEVNRIGELANGYLRLFVPIEMRKRKLDIIKLIKNVISTFQKRNDNIEFKQIFKSEQIIIGDIKELFWVIEELVNNSIKFNATFINIQILEKNNIIEIAFEDNGMGIDTKTEKNLFKVFQSKAKLSTGLGLYLIKNILKEHNAEIDYDNSYKKGTRLIITFNKI